MAPIIKYPISRKILDLFFRINANGTASNIDIPVKQITAKPTEPREQTQWLKLNLFEIHERHK